MTKFLCHFQVPEGLQTKYGSQKFTTIEVSEREGGGKQLARLSSQRRLAKSLLLVGGAVFLSQGSVSLGAKIATACIMNRVMRPEGSSSFLKGILDKSRVHRVRRDVL